MYVCHLFVETFSDESVDILAKALTVFKLDNPYAYVKAVFIHFVSWCTERRPCPHTSLVMFWKLQKGVGNRYTAVLVKLSKLATQS